MIAWLAQTLAASAVLMLAVLGLRGIVARMFGAHAAYALWLLPMLRLLIFVVPDQVPFARPAALAFQFMDAATQRTGFGHMLTAVLAPAADVTTQGLILVIWLGGAALWLIWQLTLYRRFMGHALLNVNGATRMHGIRVLITAGVAGPVAVGVLRRLVFLPTDFFRRYTRAERRLAYLHEASHHWRFDIAMNFLALMVHALHWWNPLAYHAYRIYRVDQERACDATVLARLQGAERFIYGNALIKTAAHQASSIACAFSSKDELRQRLLWLGRSPVPPCRRALGGVAACLIVAAGLSTTAIEKLPSATLTSAKRTERTATTVSYDQSASPSICKIPAAHYRRPHAATQTYRPVPFRSQIFYDI